MADGPRFDTAEAFDADYLYFYADTLNDDLSDADAAALWRLLDLDQDMEVLDLACGHGRIANRLAAKGARVTGLDATRLFLEKARADAQARGVHVDYVEGDMRQLPWRGRFDAAACVFTSFGYFADHDNRRVLHEVRQALKPGGRFWVDMPHAPWIFANFRDDIVAQRDGDWLIDHNRFEPLTGRIVTRRTVIRAGRQRSFEYAVRLFTLTELRGWLVDAGFSDVCAYSGQGEDLTVDSRHMVLIAWA